MASTMTRRPLPALVGLLALLVLTGIVWWRVANRDDSSSANPPQTSAPSCPSAGAPAGTSATPATPVSVAPKSVTVRVLNSTDRSGIAGKARQALLDDGFRSPDQAGNDSPTASVDGSAQIRYASGSSTAQAGAQLLRFYFPGSTLKAVSGKSDTVTVSLGDAFTSVSPAASVKAAIAKANTAASRSPSASGSTSPSC